MKKIKIFSLLLFSVIIISSCKKSFLDQAPGVSVTENTVFSSKVNLDQFVATMYKYGMYSLFRYQDQANFSTTVAVGASDVVHPTSDISDEGKASEASFIATNTWNSGGVLATNIVQIEDFRYYIRWTGIRQCNLVMRRAKELLVNDPLNATPAYVNQTVAEAKFLRALMYMEMIKRYGGVPIVDTVYPAGVQINAPRNSFDSCIQFIIKDCNDAIPFLPPSYASAQVGHATALAAYTLKAKALLYAASPEFNTATPYQSMPNAADNRLIGYGNYDVNRWKLAADAASAALAYASANGYGLIDDSTKNAAGVYIYRNPPVPPVGTGAPVGNYRNAWETYNNKEIIMVYQGYTAINFSNAPLKLIVPTTYGYSTWSGISVPLNFYQKYEDTLGNVVTWDAAGGSDLLDKIGKLDPRFKQTMLYTNSYFIAGAPISQIWNGGRDYKNNVGGIWMRKYIPGVNNNFLNDVIMRVNELYLDYAEAANEFTGPTDSAYQRINAIRRRSAMPALPQGLTQDQFRQRVRNEEAIEMVFDDHRLWDIRRWLIAENDGVMQGAFKGIQINQVGTSPNYKYTWLPYTFETRVWQHREYLHPFPQAEVLKGNLVQNPGW